MRVINLTGPRGWDGMPSVSSMEYQILSMAAAGCALLPNIRECFFDCTDKDMPFIRLFLGPNLTTLQIRAYKNIPPSYLSFLADLPIQHPALTTFSVDGMDTEVVSATICHWNHLRRLRVGPLSADALAHIASLPSLRELDLSDHRRGNVAAEFPYHLPFAGFPALKKLSVSSPNFQFSAHLLRSMRPGASLTSITCCANHSQTTATEWWDLLNAITGICLDSSLCDITIYDSEPSYHHPALRLTEDHLQQLLPFANLTTVRLTTTGAFDIDNRTVADMAIAWPNISYLALVGGAASMPTVTLAGLLPLAKHCPKLCSLMLAFDATEVSIGEPSPKIHNSLRNLQVLNSPLNSSARVAAFLSDIFPSLDRVATWDVVTVFPLEEDQINADLWNEVEDLVGIFALVRAQEIARAKFVEN